MSATNPPFQTCNGCGTPISAGTPYPPCSVCEAAGAATITHRPSPAASKPRPPSSIPPSPQVGFPTFVQAIHSLGLLPREDLDRLAADALGDPERLARRLIRAGRLTPYQAGAALQGKVRGLLIGSYLVLDKIAVGGMGVVFKALHQSSRRLVALKMLPPSFGQDADSVRRFRREFAIASRLTHPNIVAAIEAGEDRGVHFLTMDYIDGHDLNRLVEEGGPLELRLALHCVIQAARGLEAAHAQGVVHRDIKPGNLMIDAAGELRILDLGIARVIEATSQLGGSNTAGTITQTGTYMGTVDFLAPEQADNAKAADHRADIYSLGCTLYFLLKGQPPYPADSLLKRLMAHQTRPAPSLRAARPEVPQSLEDIYLRMVAKRPADRPQSMTEVLLELESCRSNPREAGDASTELKSFARTVIKRGVRKGPDTSVFARQNAPGGGLAFDPDLNLEDLITDFREEAPPQQPLSEDKLPPRPPRLKSKDRRVRRHAGGGAMPLAFACVGIATLAYFLWPAAQPRVEPEATTNPNSTPLLKAAASPPPLSLFDGKSLAGWQPHDSQADDWRVEEGVVVSKGRDVVNMSLFTDQTFEDFLLECQYRGEPDSNAGILLGDFGDDGQLKRYLEFNLAGSKQQGRYRNGDVFFTRPNTPTYIYYTRSPPNIHNPDGQWNDLTLEARAGQLYCSINGHQFDFPEPIYLDEPRRIGFQSYRGEFAFRDVRITKRPVTPLEDRPPRILLADDFSLARSGWPQMPESKRAEKPGYDYGYDTKTGVWYASTERPSWYSWTISTGPLPEFDADVFARVVPVAPDSRGSLVIHLFAKGNTPGADDTKTRGLQIRIDEQAQLFLEPSSWTAKNHPQGPWFGPVTHPAIKPVGQFNKLTLRVRETTMEILINGQRVVDTIAFNFKLPPMGLHFGVRSEKGPVRAEVDRVLFRALEPGVPPLSNIY